MSIFAKDCPICAASHPINATKCGCGYSFEQQKPEGITQELEAIAQEERLYRDYLAARADQAGKAWHIAKMEAAMDPGNTAKAAEALLAEQAARSARAELETQDAKAHAVSNRIKVMRSNRRHGVAPKKAPPAPQTVSARSALTPKTPAPVAKAAPRLETHPVATSPIEARKPNIPPASPTVIAQKTAPGNAAVPSRMSGGMAPGISRKPAPPAAANPPLARDPTPAFRSTQATKAAQVVSRPAIQDCPNCSAKVPPTAKRCRCGFEMPASSSEIPSLSMSAEDRAALLAALTPGRPEKT